MVFPFFADAADLNLSPPPRRNFEILTRLPRTRGEGALPDYRIRLRGIPTRRRTTHPAWEPRMRGKRNITNRS